MPVWLGASSSSGLAMTEYTVKEIGHQWIVYADRLSIGACADEDSALKLIAEDSATNGATRTSTVPGTSARKQTPPAGTGGLSASVQPVRRRTDRVAPQPR